MLPCYKKYGTLTHDPFYVILKETQHTDRRDTKAISYGLN